jgi:hypothetical protein
MDDFFCRPDPLRKEVSGYDVKTAEPYILAKIKI